MNGRERFETCEQLYRVYCGEIFNFLQFAKGNTYRISYDFEAAELSVLRERYRLKEVAGKGSEFRRALRVARWLFPRLKHDGAYDNGIACNSLALMEYCFEKENVGINCLSKAQILLECCLSLGIHARRIGLYPASPYDQDNHVVTEIYDAVLQKWVALDPTTGAYFLGEERVPLSVSEVRAKMGSGELVTAVLPRQSVCDLKRLFNRNLANGFNSYYAKNMFYFSVDLGASFGEAQKTAYVVPEGFGLKRRILQNIDYRIRLAKESALYDLQGMLAWRKNVEAREFLLAGEETLTLPPA